MKRKCLFSLLSAFMLLGIAPVSFGAGVGLVAGGNSTGISFKAKRRGAKTFDGAYLTGAKAIQGHMIFHRGKNLYFGVGARTNLDILGEENIISPSYLLKGKKKKSKKGKKDDGGGQKGKEGDTGDVGSGNDGGIAGGSGSGSGSGSSLLGDLTLRVPVGLRYNVKKFELFGELGLLMGLGDGSDNGSELNFGARYYF